MYDIISLFAAELEEPYIGISGKGLKWFFNISRYFIDRMASSQWLLMSHWPRHV